MAKFKLTSSDLETEGVRIRSGEAHAILILRSRARRIFVEDAHFHTDSSVFLPREPVQGNTDINEPKLFSNDPFWNSMRPSHPEYVESAKDGDFVPPPESSDSGGSQGEAAGGLDVILAALRFLEANRDHALVVCGHADRAGSEAHNEELSAARARCVTAVLEGDRDGYVQSAAAHDTPEADGSMLAFAARARGFPCEPRDPARPTVAEIKAFQKAYNDDFGKSIAVDGSVGNQTRGAYFDVVEAELVLQAGGKQTLDSLRAELRFVDAGKKSVACGERFPLDRAEQDGVASQTNRRVELVFFGESRPGLQGPDPAEEIYGEGNFAFERVDPETLEAIEESPAEDQLALADAPPPEDGAGDMNGPLTTEMAKLQDAPELADQYAFLTPFDEAFPDAGAQSVGDFPIATGDSVLV